MTRFETQRSLEQEQRLESYLRRQVSAVNFELIWDFLVTEGLVEVAVLACRDLLGTEQEQWVEERAEYEELRQRAELLAQFQRESLERSGTYSGPRPGRTRREEREEPEPTELSVYEVKCADTFSTYLAMHAARRWDVVQFRAASLGGLVPSGEEDIQEWQESVKLLSANEALALVNSPEHLVAGSNRRLQYATDEQSKPFYREVRPNSILDRVRRLSDTLAEDYPWHPADAARWLLTGRLVKVPPLTGSIDKDAGTLTLTARPWISAHTVTRFYREMQHRLRSGDNRPVDVDRARDILFFIEGETIARQGRPSWGTLQANWNELHPERRFKDRSNFYKACWRAYKVLLGTEPPPEAPKGW